MLTTRKVYLRLLIPIALFFISAQSSPFHHSKAKYYANDENEAANDQSLNYRLPNNSLPLNYDLWIKTDIDKGDLKFSGRVKVGIKIIDDSNAITLHSRDIIIDNVDLFDKNGILSKSNLKFEYLTLQDFLVIKLPSIVASNNEIMLDISYHGVMNDEREMSGLYRTFYKNEKFQNVWMVSSHFLPTNARKAFVCYDEPQIRAPIRLQIQHDKSYHSLSNMAVSKNQTVTGTNYVITLFDYTPPIQTYILSIIVSNLGFISNTNLQPQQRIYGESLKIRNGTANFAINVAGNLFSKFMEIFPISLGTSKIDHVQIPQFNGALEHYGLVSYEESFLLLDGNFNEEVQEFFKPQIIGIIAHGLTHQYFGGIIAPNWWQYLWLNEGFAMFYQYYIPSLLYPNYNYMDKFQNNILEYAFEVDIDIDNTMNDYVESPSEIEQKFNAIVFEKSAAVIRMFYEALSPSTFTNGLIIFLNQMRFKAASSVDLYRSLQQAYDDDNPQNEYVNISNVMSSWETQSSYPVVSVKRNGRNVILSQKPFSNERINRLYSIPITFTTKANSNFTKTIAYSWMTSQTLEINEILSTPDEWIILNIQQVGFYRVDYSRELWDAIIKEYIRNFKIIHHTNRKVLHDEMFIGWKILKTKTASDCLKLLAVLEYEQSGDVWERAAQYLDQLNDFLQFSDVYRYFQELMHKILLPHMRSLLNSKDEFYERQIVDEVRKWSTITQHPVYLDLELTKLIEIMENDKATKPNYCSALRYANTSIYRHFLNKVIKFEDFIDLELVIGLGCSMNRSHLDELFIAILNPLNDVNQFIITNTIMTTTESSIVGLEAVMDLMTQKWWDLNQILPTFVQDLTQFMHTLIKSQFHYEKFKILTNKLIQSRVLSPDVVASQLANIEAKLNEEDWKDIKEWFGIEDEQTSTTITTSTCQTENTTLDAVTLAASIRIIAICISLYFLVERNFT